MRSSNCLRVLRKVDLSITQFDNHNIDISSSNKLNLAYTLLSRDNNEVFDSFEEVRV